MDNHQFLAGKESIPPWEVFAPTEKASYVSSSGCTTSALVTCLEEVSLSFYLFFASRRRLVSVWCSQTSSAGIHMVKHLALNTTKYVQWGANILASLWHVCPCGVRAFVMLKIPRILLPTPVKIISSLKKQTNQKLLQFRGSSVGLVLKGMTYSRSRLTTGCDCLYCHGCILSPVEDFWLILCFVWNQEISPLFKRAGIPHWEA